MEENSNKAHMADRAKHLELIQGVVSRLAGNSATMKRYCIIVVAAGVAIYKTINEPNTIGALLVLVAVFWLLDARYLQQEKWFRDLYDQVRNEPPEQRPDFRLTPDEAIRNGVSFSDRVFSWSTAGLYVPLAALLGSFWLTK